MQDRLRLGLIQRPSRRIAARPGQPTVSVSFPSPVTAKSFPPRRRRRDEKAVVRQKGPVPFLAIPKHGEGCSLPASDSRTRPLLAPFWLPTLAFPTGSLFVSSPLTQAESGFNLAHQPTAIFVFATADVVESAKQPKNQASIAGDFLEQTKCPSLAHSCGVRASDRFGILTVTLVRHLHDSTLSLRDRLSGTALEVEGGGMYVVVAGRR